MDLFATRAIARFRCLGADCEDHCCGDWRVPVGQAHYELLRERMSSPEERAELAACVRPIGEGGNAQRYALLVLDEGGCCSLLSSDRLCSIQARYGEELLPDGCATYPRAAARVGERAELTGTTSCPEIARLVLLADDGNDFAPAEPVLFGRGHVVRRIEDGSADPYESSFLAVRGLAVALLKVRRFPLASRLFFLAFFADRTRDQLRRGVARFDAGAVQQLGRALQSEQALADLHGQYEAAAASIDQPFGISVVRALLQLPAAALPAALQQIGGEVGDFYGERGAPLGGDVGALHRAYADLPPLPPVLVERLDRVLERYAIQHLQRHWYVAADSLNGYVHGLLARVGLIRFLVRTLAARDQLAEPARFDALCVRVVYATSRMLEHDDDVAARLLARLEAQGGSLGHAICLTSL